MNPYELLEGTTDDILDALDTEFGSHEWVPPVETRGTFETDLNNILDDFYEKAGEAFGDEQYGEFYSHGGRYDRDWDWGLGTHGVPVHQHEHFWYNGDYRSEDADKFAHNYITVDYPEE